jgi:hypothetical protein
MALILIALAVALPALVMAQEKPADTMQLVVEKVRADKKLLVATNMELSEAEAKGFWPVYDRYQDELFLLRQRTARLIGDYAAVYANMTDDKAKTLLDELLTIEALGVKLRETYLPELLKVLPAVKVARYIQIENKINAALMYELADRIPLVKDASK